MGEYIIELLKFKVSIIFAILQFLLELIQTKIITANFTRRAYKSISCFLEEK